MASKLLVILSSADREVALNVGLVYPLNAAKHKWMDEVRVIVFGPSEKLAAYDHEVRAKLRELIDAGVEVLACKWCSDKLEVSKPIEELGVKVTYVGSVISQLLKDGWIALTF
jgi:hypothetical protein